MDPFPAGFEAVDSSLAVTSRAPDPDGDQITAFGGSRAFDHSEVRDDEVRLYASQMPPGVHTWRYVVRATSPGEFIHPPTTVEAMYQPEIFGRTQAGRMHIGAPEEVASATP